jgi:hypothetical protein
MISKSFEKIKKFMQPIRRLRMHSGGPNIFSLGYFCGRRGRICLGGDALLSKQVRVSPRWPTKKLHKSS